jgi:hypothetical protein
VVNGWHGQIPLKEGASQKRYALEKLKIPQIAHKLTSSHGKIRQTPIVIEPFGGIQK